MGGEGGKGGVRGKGSITSEQYKGSGLTRGENPPRRESRGDSPVSTFPKFVEASPRGGSGEMERPTDFSNAPIWAKKGPSPPARAGPKRQGIEYRGNPEEGEKGKDLPADSDVHRSTGIEHGLKKTDRN